MIRPARLRLSRARGFDLQAASRALNGLDAVVVARPTAWGNPFVVGRDGTRAECVRLHRILMGGFECLTSKATLDQQDAALQHIRTHIGDLRGKNLACWCSLDGPCHADTLLEAANKPSRGTSSSDDEAEGA